MTEMERKGKKKKRKLSNKEKLMFAGGALYSTLLLVGAYKVGRDVTDLKIDRGIRYCWSIDPTFKTHMEEVLTKAHKKKITF